MVQANPGNGPRVGNTYQMRIRINGDNQASQAIAKPAMSAPAPVSQPTISKPQQLKRYDTPTVIRVAMALSFSSSFCFSAV